jgi:transcriptional regulator with XRE-family HTH domain
MDTELLTRKRSPREAGMLTPAQLRAARAIVGWSREKLAEKADVSAETIKRFEFRGSDPKLSTLNKVRRALEAAGVEFIDDGAKSDEGGPGVRLRGAKAKR